MPKLANVVTIEVEAARRDEVVTLLLAHKARCLKDEPSTLQLEVPLPKDDDSKVLMKLHGVRGTVDESVR